MGLLAERFSDTTRNRADWLTDAADDDAFYGPMTSAGVRVNARAALSLTTIWRCVDLLSSAVAQSPKDIFVKIGGQSFPEFTKPDWLVHPNPLDETYTVDDYFGQVALSLLLEGNYFVSVFPYVWDPQVLTVLAPSRVTVKPGPRYEIRDEYGHLVSTLGPMEMLHGTWLRPAGELRGISPLEAMRRSIGSAIAAEDFAARFFGQGASMSFGVEVPGGLDTNQKKDMADSLKRRYAGLQNSHAIGVLTNGAKFVTGLAPTPEQAQMIATRNLAHKDLCRPYGVPPGMAGGEGTGESYAASEVDDLQFKERAVLPLAVRIERQHNRLVTVPDTITDPNASAQFKFNLDGVARVNILTRAQAYRELVFAGVMQPAEARVKEDLPPVKGADQLFMQSQMVPIDKLGLIAAPAAPAPEG